VEVGLDGAREVFHDDQANALIAREYGGRFEMPLQVQVPSMVSCHLPVVGRSIHSRRESIWA
jgi:hypothetical protein